MAELMVRKDVPYARQKILLIVRLRNEVIRTALQSLNNVSVIGKRGQKDKWHMSKPLVLLHFPAEFVPIHLRHHDVADGETRHAVSHLLKSIFPVYGNPNRVPLLFEQVFELFGLCGAVLDDVDLHILSHAFLLDF